MSNVSSDSEPGIGQQPAKKVPWGPWVAVLYAVVIYFVSQFIASLIVIIYPHIRGWGSVRAEHWLVGATTAQFWYVLFAEALTVGAIWLFVRSRKSSLRAIGWRRFDWWAIVYALAGFAAYFVAYIILFTIATHLVPSLNVNQKQELGFDHAQGTLNLWLAFISLVILPPLAEETVFRGFVFTGLRNRLSPVWAAIGTSLLFAAAHLEFGSGKPLLWVAALDTFTLSLVLCYLRYKIDSLWPGIFLHAIKNGLAFVTLFLLHAH